MEVFQDSASQLHARVAAGCLALSALACARADDSFAFAVIGDAPYVAAAEARFVAAIEAMNRSELAFVVHVGDLEAPPGLADTGTPTCTDEALESRRAMFAASRHPFVLTPGDNDWLDCHLAGLDPLARLARLRAVFFASDASLGQEALPLAVQAREPGFERFVENRAWTRGGVRFATLHLVAGSDEGARTPPLQAEAREREAAALAWLAETFARARAEGARAVVLFTQANPLFELDWSEAQVYRYLLGLTVPADAAPRAGFETFRAALRAEVEDFAGPVLLVHGDTHTFRLDKPLARPDGSVQANFTRLETFGHPDVHWVRVEVDPGDPDVFSVRPVAVRR